MRSPAPAPAADPPPRPGARLARPPPSTEAGGLLPTQRTPAQHLPEPRLGRPVRERRAAHRLRLDRTSALALVLLTSAGTGALRVHRWPDARPALECPGEAIGWSDAGVALCHAGGPVPPDVARALGRPLDLNQVPEEALARLPGIGARVAHTLVLARSRAPFRSWEAVDAVPGVGPARLATLQRFTVLGP